MGQKGPGLFCPNQKRLGSKWVKGQKRPGPFCPKKGSGNYMKNQRISGVSKETYRVYDENGELKRILKRTLIRNIITGTLGFIDSEEQYIPGIR